MLSVPAKFSVYIINYSLSCELSALNFGRVVEFLRKNAYILTHDICHADIVLINSCCVISGKRKLVRSSIEMARNRDNVKKVIVFGCFAGIQATSAQDVIMIPSRSIEQVDEHFEHRTSIREIEGMKIDQNVFVPYQSSFADGMPHVMICQGCVNRCSYCNIKNAKGGVQSRPVHEIVEDIHSRISDDNNEFVLIADDCGSYGQDIQTNIVDLLQQILACDPRVKLRIHYLFPRVLLEYEAAFLELFSTNRITYANIPIQSGSQRILTLMNRSYDIVHVLHLASRIKRLSPQTWLYTHIIVNFPTEIEKDLHASLHATRVFDEVLFMNYSKNPLTPAYQLPDVEQTQKEKTLQTVSSFLKKGPRGMLIDSDSGTPI